MDDERCGWLRGWAGGWWWKTLAGARRRWWLRQKLKDWPAYQRVGPRPVAHPLRQRDAGETIAQLDKASYGCTLMNVNWTPHCAFRALFSCRRLPVEEMPASFSADPSRMRCQKLAQQTMPPAHSASLPGLMVPRWGRHSHSDTISTCDSY